MGLLLLVIAIVQVLSYGDAICPQDQTGLTKWSSKGSAWNSASASVTIPAGTRYLFDLSSCTVQNIIVNGDLIFADQAADLTTAHILINPTGRLFMGSDEAGCAIKSKITITFVGDRTDNSNMGNDPIDGQPLGSKGIAATTNSTISIVGNAPAFTWTRIAATAQAGASTITVKDNVGWSVGDTIVIASTDFHSTIPWSEEVRDYPYYYLGRGNADQNELKTIKSISGTSITLDTPLKYSHWGSGYEFAEVGVINRNIVFTGDSTTSTTSFGGHFMIRKCSVAKLKGFEITKFGQKGVLGRYPLHFHHAEEVWGRGFYADSLSVHDCFQRCMVIHDTHGVTLSNNVAWNNNGHCYFLEDGSERGNTLTRNLGVKTTPIRKSDPNILIPSDENAAMFWITNPNNTFIGNAAVESVFGFWFSMPPSPTGLAAARYAPNDPLVRPRWSPLGAFKDNVVHGSLRNGLHIDDMELGIGSADPLETQLASWNPGNAPYGEESYVTSPLTATLEGLIAYKNREYGSWARGGPFIFTNFKCLDNMRGFNAPPEPSVLINSLIVGETDNIGTPMPEEKGRSRPGRYDINDLIKGWETYDNGGNQHVESTIFVNFTSDSIRPAGAISALECGPFLLHSRDRSRNITLINANPSYLSDCPQGGDNTHAWSFLDTDGTLTGAGPSWIVSKNKLMIDSTCTLKPEWNAYSCPFFAEGGYIQLAMNLMKLDGLNKDSTYKYLFDNQGTYYNPETSNATRATFTTLGTTDSYDGLGNAIDGSTGQEWLLQSNVKARRGYALRFPNIPTPPNMYMYIASALPNDWIILNIVYPKSYFPITLTLNNEWAQVKRLTMTKVNSLSELNAMNEYYYDDATENMYFFLTYQGTNYDENFGYHNQYGNDGYTISMEAQGTPSVPSANSQKVPAAVPSPYKYDSFKADLQSCQVTPSISSNRRGSAYFLLDQETSNFNYRVAHDLGTNVKSVTINQGAAGTNGEVVANFEWNDTPINFFTSLSRRLWVQLLLGNLYVSVVDNSGKEQSRGQIGCVGTCTLPPAIPTQDKCSTANFGSDALTVYTDGVLGDKLRVYGNLYTDTANTNINTTQKTDTTTFACGNSSIRATAKRGVFGFGIYPSIKVTSDYKFIQFYIKLAPGTTFNQLRLIIDTDTGNINQQDSSQLIPSKYIDNLAFDSADWSRARIPLSFLNFTGDVGVNGIYFWTRDWGYTPTDMWIDEVKFIKNVQDTTSTGITQSQIASYKSYCTQTGATGDLGQGSGNFATGQMSSATVAQMCFAIIAVALFLL